VHVLLASWTLVGGGTDFSWQWTPSFSKLVGTCDWMSVRHRAVWRNLLELPGTGNAKRPLGMTSRLETVQVLVDCQTGCGPNFRQVYAGAGRIHGILNGKICGQMRTTETGSSPGNNKNTTGILAPWAALRSPHRLNHISTSYSRDLHQFPLPALDRASCQFGSIASQTDPCFLSVSPPEKS
jgi:hypothetical protein